MINGNSWSWESASLLPKSFVFNARKQWKQLKQKLIKQLQQQRRAASGRCWVAVQLAFSIISSPRRLRVRLRHRDGDRDGDGDWETGPTPMTAVIISQRPVLAASRVVRTSSSCHCHWFAWPTTRWLCVWAQRFYEKGYVGRCAHRVGRKSVPCRSWGWSSKDIDTHLQPASQPAHHLGTPTSVTQLIIKRKKRNERDETKKIIDSHKYCAFYWFQFVERHETKKKNGTTVEKSFKNNYEERYWMRKYWQKYFVCRQKCEILELLGKHKKKDNKKKPKRRS